MISRRAFLSALLPIGLAACSTRDVTNLVRGVVSGGSLQGAVKNVAIGKAQGWASNPASLVNDLKNFEKLAQKFVGDVVQVWGQENARTPSPKVYVKYSDAYHTRSIIDFDKGLVRVETLHPQNLQRAIVLTVLSPDDPREVDLFSAQEPKLGGVPFLFEQVRDQDGKSIRWEWRANRFAQFVMRRKQVQTIRTQNGQLKQQTFVEFPLVATHRATRENQYAPLVRQYAAQYRISRPLVYAIIQTESNFNRFAVSWVPAYGLMQIVPRTAGRDAYEVVHGRKGTPTRDYLFDPHNNIRMGTAYLHILQTRYLARVKDPLTREYCVIAAYNGGAGNVLRCFSKNRDQAFAQINRSSPSAVYRTLKARMPKESQRYLDKVTTAKQRYA